MFEEWYFHKPYQNQVNIFTFLIILKFDKLRHFLCSISMEIHDLTFMNKHKSFNELFNNIDDLVCISCQ